MIRLLRFNLPESPAYRDVILFSYDSVSSLLFYLIGSILNNL